MHSRNFTHRSSARRLLTVVAVAGAAWLAPTVAQGAPPSSEALIGEAFGIELPEGIAFAEINDLSCSAPGECIMVGYYTPTSAAVNTETNPQTGFVVTLSDGEWGDVSELPGLSALDAARRGNVRMVECPAVGQCTAVGTYGYVDDWNGSPWIRSRNFIASLTAGEWSVTDLADAPFETIGALACPTHGECIIGGGGLSNRAFLIPQSSGVWNAPELIEFVGDLSSTTSPSVTDIVCTSPGHCTAIGEIGGGASRRAFAVDVRNGVVQTATNAYGGNETAQAVELRDISCHEDVCSAVGRGGVPLPLRTLPGQAKVAVGESIQLATVNRLTPETAETVVAAFNARVVGATKPLTLSTDTTSGSEVVVLDGLMVAYGDSTKTVRIPVSEVLHIESGGVTMLVASAGATDIPIKLGAQEQVRVVNNGIVALAATGLPQSADGDVFTWGTQQSHISGLARLSTDANGVLVQQFVIDSQTRNNLSTSLSQLVIAVGDTRVVFGAESNSTVLASENVTGVTNPAGGTPLARFGHVSSAVRPGTVLMTVDGVTRPASIRLLNGTGSSPPQTTRGSHAVPLLERFNALAEPTTGPNAMQFNPSTGSNLEGLLVNPENAGETSRPRGDGVFVIHPGTTAPNSTTAANLDVLVFLAMATRETSGDPPSAIRAYNQTSGTTPLLVRQTGRPAFLAVGAVGLPQGDGSIEILHGKPVVGEAMSPMRSQAAFDTSGTNGVLLDQFELDLGTSSATNLNTGAQTMVLRSGNVTIAFPVNVATSGSYAHHLSGYATRVSARRGELTADRGNPTSAVTQVELDAPPTLPIVTSRTASTWTSTVLDDTPRQGGSSDGPILRDVDCTSAANCVGAGWYGSQGEPRRAFVTEQIDGIWQPTRIIDWDPQFGAPLSIEAVRCAGPGDCVVFGQNSRPGGSVIQRPFVLEQRSGVWGDVVELPGPWDQTDVEQFAAAKHLECVEGQCIAVGLFLAEGLLFATPFGLDERPTTPLPPPPAPSTTAPDSTVPDSSVPDTTVPEPVVDAAGEPPRLDVGELVVTVGGAAQEVEVRIENDDRDLVMRSDDFELRLSGECTTGCAITTDPDGRAVLEVDEAGAVRVEARGFASGTPVNVWMYSEPVLLGTGVVTDSGEFVGSFAIPNVEPGVHTIQVIGTASDGAELAALLGVRVREALPPPGPVGQLPNTGQVDAPIDLVVFLSACGALLIMLTRRPLSPARKG